MVKEAFGIIWQSLKDAWDDLFTLSVSNAVWLFTSLTVLLLPVSTAGMYCITNQVAHGRAPSFNDFKEGALLYWWRAWLWFLAYIGGTFLMIYALWFYTELLADVAPVLQILVGGFWFMLIVTWVSMQIYFWPLMIEQQEKKMAQAWRNAFVLFIQEPVYTLILGIAMLFFTFLSIILPVSFILVYMTVIGVLSNNATLQLLHKAGVIDAPRPRL